MHNTLPTIDKFGGAVNDGRAAAAAYLFPIAHAVVAAVHTVDQHQTALDGPMVGGIPGPGNVLAIPLVNVPCIGVDKDAFLRLFKLHAGTCRGFDIRIREVVKIDAVGRLRIALNVALVFDVQVAGGVHRQHLAAARKVNIADDVGMGGDIHRSIVQQLHTVGSDGHVDPATGVAAVALGSGVQGSPGHLDVQPGFVLHGQNAGADAPDSIAIEVAPAVIHVDVHGGAAVLTVPKIHLAGANAIHGFLWPGRVLSPLIVDVQGAAAADGHAIGVVVRINGTGILDVRVVVGVQRQGLPGGDSQDDVPVVGIQQTGLAAHGRVLLYGDIDMLLGADGFDLLHVDERAVEFTLQIQST